jgi:hypothetical protein
VRFARLVDPNIDKIKQLLDENVTVASYQINAIGCFLSGVVVATNIQDSSNMHKHPGRRFGQPRQWHPLQAHALANGSAGRSTDASVWRVLGA